MSTVWPKCNLASEAIVLIDVSYKHDVLGMTK